MRFDDYLPIKTEPMTPEKAQALILKLQERFYGEQMNDLEVLNRALEQTPGTGMALFAVVAIYRVIVGEFPQYSLWIIASFWILVPIFTYRLIRERRRIEAARSYFIKCAPSTLADAMECLNKTKA